MEYMNLSVLEKVRRCSAWIFKYKASILQYMINFSDILRVVTHSFVGLLEPGF